MNRPTFLPGFILIGLGTYFLLKQLNLPWFVDVTRWPLILMIIGSAFIISSLTGEEIMLILPGGILFSLGLHFMGVSHISEWPTHWSMYPGAVGVGFILTFLRTRNTVFLIPAGVLLTIPTVVLVFDGMELLFDWWPIALIIIGIYFILNRKS